MDFFIAFEIRKFKLLSQYLQKLTEINIHLLVFRSFVWFGGMLFPFERGIFSGELIFVRFLVLAAIELSSGMVKDCPDKVLY